MVRDDLVFLLQIEGKRRILEIKWIEEKWNILNICDKGKEKLYGERDKLICIFLVFLFLLQVRFNIWFFFVKNLNEIKLLGLEYLNLMVVYSIVFFFK